MECQCNCIGSNVRQSNLGTAVESIVCLRVIRPLIMPPINLWGWNWGGPLGLELGDRKSVV